MTKPVATCKLPRGLSDDDHKPSSVHSWQRWAFAVIPAAGILELTAHAVQTHSVVADADWQAARAYVAGQAKPDDLIVFAPSWADPVGRQAFGRGLATVAREARPDESRFSHAFEVSIRGAHAPALSTWTRAGTSRFGGVTVTQLDNPSPAHVISDLVALTNPQALRVIRVDGARESECSFVHAAIQTGGLGFGTPLPGDRFECPGGGFVGVSIVEDSNYRPHQCIYAPPLGGSSILRLVFASVAMGRSLHGHHTLYVEAEHFFKSDVSVTFAAKGSVLGRALHRDGDGWKPFEFDTSDLAGSSVELTVTLEAGSSERRMYCLEADTR